VNGMTSNVSVDSKRVKVAQLATDSQHMRSSQISRRYNLPVSFWPPIQPTDQPYGPARHKHQRGQLKIERINDKSISQTPKVETAHLWNAHSTLPPNILSKRRNRVFGPIRLRARPKIERINISQAPEDKGTHLGHDPIVQPSGDDLQRSYRVIGPRHRCGRLKPQPTNVSRMPEDEKTYQGLHKPILPLPRDAGDPSRSTPIRHLPYSLQSLKNNLQKVSRDDKKSNRIKYAPECKQINDVQRAHHGHVTYQIW